MKPLYLIIGTNNYVEDTLIGKTFNREEADRIFNGAIKDFWRVLIITDEYRIIKSYFSSVSPMYALRVFKSGSAEVIKLYSTNNVYLYSGFNSEEEAKQAVMNERVNRNLISNDIEPYQAHCEAQKYVDNGTWVRVLSQGEYKITY